VKWVAQVWEGGAIGAGSWLIVLLLSATQNLGQPFCRIGSACWYAVVAPGLLVVRAIPAGIPRTSADCIMLTILASPVLWVTMGAIFWYVYGYELLVHWSIGVRVLMVIGSLLVWSAACAAVTYVSVEKLTFHETADFILVMVGNAVLVWLPIGAMIWWVCVSRPMP